MFFFFNVITPAVADTDAGEQGQVTQGRRGMGFLTLFVGVHKTFIIYYITLFRHIDD